MSRRKSFWGDFSAEMGYIDVSYQTVTFLLSVLIGGIMCIVYDILRVLHRYIIKTVLGVFVSDIIYWLMSAVAVFFLLILRCDGNPRFFVISGVIIGFSITRISASRVVFWILDKFAFYIMGILHFVFNQTERIFIHITKILIKSLLVCKKVLQHKLNLLYNHLRLKCGKKRRLKNGCSN